MLKLENVKIHVIDALSIYKNVQEGVDVYTSEELEKAFIMANNNSSNDASLKEKHVYFILGISDFKKSISKYEKNFKVLFYDSDKYKLIQVEDWYRDNINNTFGIWLGEGIDTQVSLGVMSLTMEDKKTVFPCIGYPIYQGNHMVIKYVVDGVDKKDEE